MNWIAKALIWGLLVVVAGCGDSASSANESPKSESVTAAKTQSTSQGNGVSSTVAQTSKTPPATVDEKMAYVEGTHFERLPIPVATVDKAKIEVAEVFWYGCSHCFDFESILRPWSSQLAGDVILIQSPAIWDNQQFDDRDPAKYYTPMANHARIYYTAKVLGVLDEMSLAAFRALNVDRKPLRTVESIEQLFVDNNVSLDDVKRVFPSYGVTNFVKKAQKNQALYQVRGTPEIVVNGTYRVNAKMAGGHQGMLKVVDFLVDQIREERKK